MADKTYGLYPFPWHPPGTRQVMSGGVLIDVTIPGYHSAPNGAGCLFDWRPIGEQAKQGPSDGYGFFAWTGQPPQDLIVLGVGDCRTIVATSTMRSELRLKLGLSRDPAGATLIDLCHDVMGPLASPDGSTGVRPLMPTREEEIEMHLAGHSRVKVVKFTPAQLLAANPTGHANRIRDVIRMNLDIADDAGKLGEALGHWLVRCGYSREQVKAGAPGKKTEFERLCSAKVRAKYGNSLKPKEPRTSFSETWPNNCADIEATAQDQTWTTLEADGFFNTIKVVSGTARADNSTVGQKYKLGICSSAVSSDNHWANGVINIGAESAPKLFVNARSAASRATFYCHGVLQYQSRTTYKCVEGALTELYSSETISAHGKTAEINCNGSTISGRFTSLANRDVTDTAITGNLRGGLWIFLDAYVDTYGTIGAWSIDDGLPAAPVAAFSGTPLSGTAPLSVAFTDASTNTPTSWLWEKSSDGGSNWSNFASGHTSQNPTESFTAGTWAVRLTATNAGGSDGETKLAYVVVTAAGGAGVSAQMLLEGWL